MSSLSNMLPDSVKHGFTDGENYDSHRPSYTDDVCEEVIKMLGVTSTQSKDKQTTILELGAGTGKFTSKLNERLKKCGDINFIATEPMSELLKVLQRKYPDVPTIQCTAENLALEDASVQGIVAAQSFHWFANNKALDEIHRVLSDKGNFVLLWNFNDRNVDWINEIHNRIDKLRTDPNQYHGLNWKPIIDNHPGFTFIERKVVKGTCIKGDINTVLAHCSTHSGIQKLDKNERSRELDEIRNILTSHPDTYGQDLIQLQFLTDIYHYKKV